MKECPYCKKEVVKTAIKCPYCQEWLNKKDITFKNPMIRALLFLIIVYSSYYFFIQIINSKTGLTNYRTPENYSKNSSKLFIKKHQLIKRKKTFAVIGEIENKEIFKWSSVIILATFKDNNGELSSLGTGYIHNLEANSTKPFEIKIGCSEEPYDPDKYGSYDIEIDEASGDYRRNEKNGDN